MENRTRKIEQLLMYSKRLDIKESDFNREIYNKILNSLKFESRSFDDEAKQEAYDIINYVKVRKFAPNNYHVHKLKTRKYSEPRQIAMTLIKYNTMLSLTDIGDIFGGRDHATVLHAMKTTSKLYQTDKKYRIMLDNIIKEQNYKFEIYE